MLISSAKSADRVIAISHATADDIGFRLGRTKDISVVHNGIPIAVPGSRPSEKPYIFAMASQFPHKNTEDLLAAYCAYRAQVESPLPLVICGISGSN